MYCLRSNQINKIMKKIIILGMAFLFALHINAKAQTATPRATKRQVNQQVRIKEGKKSGELTEKEAAGLKAQQRHIRRTKRRAKADGVVTGKEKAKIQRKQNRANRSIRRQKNDKDKKE